MYITPHQYLTILLTGLYMYSTGHLYIISLKFDYQPYLPYPTSFIKF